MLSSDQIQMPVGNVKSPEVGMAPLIDVIFLLLIFFMVTTVFPDEGIMIDKPGADQSSRLVDNKIIINVDKSGNYYYKKEHITIADIKRLVRSELTSRPEIAVIVNIDKRAVTQSLVSAINAAKSAGAVKLGIATDSHEVDAY